MLTDGILSLMKDAPVRYDDVEAGMTRCELFGSGNMSVKIDVYDKCLESGFKDTYDRMFEDLKTKMKNEQGLIWNPDTHLFEKSFELESHSQVASEIEVQKVGW